MKVGDEILTSIRIVEISEDTDEECRIEAVSVLGYWHEVGWVPKIFFAGNEKAKKRARRIKRGGDEVDN